MSTLMTDPVDHWLDLPVESPRKPLMWEMFSAGEQALLAPADPPYRRAAWTGVFTGYAVAFGLVTREALDRARRTPHATATHPDELRIGPFTDEDDCWASGVLYGYSQGISEHPDVQRCPTCGLNLLPDLDWTADCHHGVFCEDHIADFHAGGGFGADVCTYLDGE